MTYTKKLVYKGKGQLHIITNLIQVHCQTR